MSKYTKNFDTPARSHDTYTKAHDVTRSHDMLGRRTTDPARTAYGGFSKGSEPRGHDSLISKNDVEKERLRVGIGEGTSKPATSSFGEHGHSPRISHASRLHEPSVSDKQYHLRGDQVDYNVQNMNGTVGKAEHKGHPASESLYLKRYDKYVLSPSKEHEKHHPSPSVIGHSGSQDSEHGTKLSSGRETFKARPPSFNEYLHGNDSNRSQQFEHHLGKSPLPSKKVDEQDFGHTKLQDLRESWKKHRTDKETDTKSPGDRSIDLKRRMLYGSPDVKRDTVSQDIKDVSNSAKTDSLQTRQKARTKLHYGAKKPEEPVSSSKSQSLLSHSEKSSSSSSHTSINQSEPLCNKDLKKVTESKVLHKSGYSPGKTADVGNLLYANQLKESKTPQAELGTILDMGDMSQTSREERIARYKEERRKQLASMTARMHTDIKSGLSSASPEVKPSLFTAECQAKEMSPVSRSQSLKAMADSAQKSPTVSRSSSLRTDVDTSRHKSPHKTRKDIQEEIATFDAQCISTPESKKTLDLHSLISDVQDRGRRILPDKEKLEHRLALASMQGVHARNSNNDKETKQMPSDQRGSDHYNIFSDMKLTEAKKRQQLPSVEALIGSREHEVPFKKREPMSTDAPLKHGTDILKRPISDERNDAQTKLREKMQSPTARPLSDSYSRGKIIDDNQQKDLSALSRTLLIKASRMPTTEVPKELVSSVHERWMTPEHLKHAPPTSSDKLIHKAGVSAELQRTSSRGTDTSSHLYSGQHIAAENKPGISSVEFGWPPKQSAARAASFHELSDTSTRQVKEPPVPDASTKKQGDVVKASSFEEKSSFHHRMPLEGEQQNKLEELKKLIAKKKMEALIKAGKDGRDRISIEETKIAPTGNQKSPRITKQTCPKTPQKKYTKPTESSKLKKENIMGWHDTESHRGIDNELAPRSDKHLHPTSPSDSFHDKSTSVDSRSNLNAQKIVDNPLVESEGKIVYTTGKVMPGDKQIARRSKVVADNVFGECSDNSEFSQHVRKPLTIGFPDAQPTKKPLYSERQEEIFSTHSMPQRTNILKSPKQSMPHSRTSHQAEHLDFISPKKSLYPKKQEHTLAMPTKKPADSDPGKKILYAKKQEATNEKQPVRFPASPAPTLIQEDKNMLRKPLSFHKGVLRDGPSKEHVSHSPLYTQGHSENILSASPANSKKEAATKLAVTGPHIASVECTNAERSPQLFGTVSGLERMKTPEQAKSHVMSLDPHMAPITQLHTGLESANYGNLGNAVEKAVAHTVSRQPKVAPVMETSANLQSYEKTGDIATTEKYDTVERQTVSHKQKMAPLIQITDDMFQLSQNLSATPPELTKMESHVVSEQTKVAPLKNAVSDLESKFEQVGTIDNVALTETVQSQVVSEQPKATIKHTGPQLTSVTVSKETRSIPATASPIKSGPTTAKILAKDYPNKGLSRTDAFRIDSKIAPALMPLRESSELYFKQELSKASKMISDSPRLASSSSQLPYVLETEKMMEIKKVGHLEDKQGIILSQMQSKNLESVGRKPMSKTEIPTEPTMQITSAKVNEKQMAAVCQVVPSSMTTSSEMLPHTAQPPSPVNERASSEPKEKQTVKANEKKKDLPKSKKRNKTPIKPVMRFLTETPDTNLDDLVTKNLQYLKSAECVKATDVKIRKSLKKKLRHRSKSMPEADHIQLDVDSKRNSKPESEEAMPSGVHPDKQEQISHDTTTDVKQKTDKVKTGYKSTEADRKNLDGDDDENFTHKTLVARSDKFSLHPSGKPPKVERDSHLLISETVLSKYDSDQVSVSSSVADVTSDTSDMLSLTGMRNRELNVYQDTESVRMTTDSDSTVASYVDGSTERTKKKRKDKSTMRKSSLNQSIDDADVITRGRDSPSQRVAAPSHRMAARAALSPTSSLTESRDRLEPDKSCNDVPAVTVHKVISLSKLDLPLHASSSQIRVPPLGYRTDELHTDPSHCRAMLDSRSVLPTKFGVPSKVSAAISKLYQGEAKVRETSLIPEKDSPRRFPRGANFSQLLQRFSGSDRSSSERSDGEQQSPNKKLVLMRQEAYTVISSNEECDHDDSRKTPERTQSLRIRQTPSPDSRHVQRSSSLKHASLSSRFSPGRSNNFTKQDSNLIAHSDKYSVEKTESSIDSSEDSHKHREFSSRKCLIPDQSDDKPSLKLAPVLNQRSDIVAVQQNQGRQKVFDKGVDKKHIQSATEVDEVIVDAGLAGALKSRQTETDNQRVLHHTVPSSIAVHPSKSHNLNIDSIDTSLAVLNAVMDNISDRNRDYSLSDRSVNIPHLSATKTESKSTDISTSLAKVNVDSPAEVAQFLKDVQQGISSEKPESLTEKAEIKSTLTEKKLSKERITTGNASNQKFTKSPTKADLLSSKSSTLTRTESMGRSDSMGQHKQGILKRTPSLPKQTRAIVDKELAGILDQRRLMEGNKEDSDAENEDSRPTSVVDDIKASSRREKLLKGGSQSSSDEEQKIVPIAERIFKMETKIEEIKSCPLTPKSKSGQHTPKSPFKSRSEVMTPKSQKSVDDSHEIPSLSGEQLMQKLSNLADKGKAIRKRKQQFQHRLRDDWRTRTQPVTEEEVSEADSLNTVREFRAEVRKKSCINVFEHFNKPENRLLLEKKIEYPQPFRKGQVRRSRLERHKTLPVTAAEISAIPEGEAIIFKAKFDSSGVRDSRADSGILSGSDVESFADRESQGSDSLRSLEEDDDPVKLSVSAKASLFHQMAETAKEKKSSASGAKRYIDRKKRERSQTQPVTNDEVETAAKLADSGDSAQPQDENKGNEYGRKEMTEQEEKDCDELASRSLAEKVKLFQRIKEAEQTPLLKPNVVKRRNRKQASRFNTQPVTVEEVEKAAVRINPLAMSLVKPPAPEKLSGLSLKAQMEIMSQHAGSVLAQLGSRSASGSRSGSVVGSAGDLSELGQDTKGTHKAKDETKDKHEKQSILKHEFPKSTEREVKGILKPDAEEKDPDNEPRSILRQRKAMQQKAHLIGQELRGILKQEDKEKCEFKPSEMEPRGILKQHEDDSEDEQLKGILKHKEMLDSQSGKLRSALKYERSFEKYEDADRKGILKKESSFEMKKTEPDKSSLKKSQPNIQEVHGILKKSDSSDMDDSKDEYLTADEELPIATEEREQTSASLNRRRDRKGERYLTQPAEFPSTEETPKRHSKLKSSGRHMTQPVTPEEKREAEAVGLMDCVETSGSVSDRLDALKKSGEEEWKKRILKKLDFETPVKLDEKRESMIPRPSSIADRLNKLEESQTGWRERVEESDAKQFTIAQKITATGHVVEDSPLVSKFRKPRKDFYLKDSDSECSELTSPSTPTKEFVCAKVPIPTEIISSSEPIVHEEDKKEEEEKKEEEKKVPTKVEIPKLSGDEFQSFFSTKHVSEITEKIDVSVDDFNELFIVAEDILTTTKKIRPKRRHMASKQNPLKAMAATLQVQEEYEEIITGVAEKELRRIQTAAISKDAGFAQAALAGLASKENFAKVGLRKAGESGPYGGLEPFKDLMLLHIKGRKHVQTRLVEPIPSSINSGDCYVLVTPDKIINWVGEFSNVIEKAKAFDVASFIQQKRDLGSKGTVVTVDECKQHLKGGQQFWDCLGGKQDYQASGPPDEDELFENHIVETNMVYRLEDNKLLPYEEYWGLQPKFEMLKKDEVLVFDFGSELYLWQGKLVAQQKRKLGIKLAQQLCDKGYDYSSCHINPLSPLKTEEVGGIVNRSLSRPTWCLFGKTNQNMETILFREKFQDWPDTSRLIKVKDHIDLTASKSDLSELKPYDAKLMLPINMSVITLVLEGSNVGRGNKWFEDMDGFVREQNIVTLGIMIWHVLEYDHFSLAEESFGQFHEGDTYVVRWKYTITAGVKNIKGLTPHLTKTGRERYAYFFWQGKGSTVNEKGASALMTVELDEERGPQIQVEEGKEPPCFLNLFRGNMIIHIGKREDASTNTQGCWRLYCICSDIDNELCLMEIPAGLHNFRSRSSLILLNVDTGILYIWHGHKSLQHMRTSARSAAERLKKGSPLEVGVHNDAVIVITEMEEGSELSHFWQILDAPSGDRSDYLSLLRDPLEYDHTIRLFYLSSVAGTFDANEIHNPSRCSDRVSSFPFFQSDLYRVSQPALFLVDSGTEMYLWHGWWPEGDVDIANLQTGSAKARYNVDRKCAMETTIAYCEEKDPENPPKAFVVYSGLEPKEFTNLFPFWEENVAAKDINLKDGKERGEKKAVIEELAKVTRTRYALAELMELPLPEGVDPLRMESYLADDEFQEVLDMSKEDFYSLHVWKQTNIKREAGLF